MLQVHNPQGILKFVKSLAKFHPDDVGKHLYDYVESGFGLLHEAAGHVEMMARKQVMKPALNMAGQNGQPLYMTPNYAMDLKRDEISISYDDASFIKEMFKNDPKNKGAKITKDSLKRLRKGSLFLYK